MAWVYSIAAVLVFIAIGLGMWFWSGWLDEQEREERGD